MEKPKNLTTSKRPRNKRKATQSKPPEKPSYDPPVADENPIEVSNNSLTNNKLEPKRRKKDNDNNPRNKYHSPTQAPKDIKESDTNQGSTTEYRRSPRVPRLTTKYLESIKAELRNSDEDE